MRRPRRASRPSNSGTLSFQVSPGGRLFKARYREVRKGAYLLWHGAEQEGSHGNPASLIRVQFSLGGIHSSAATTHRSYSRAGNTEVSADRMGITKGRVSQIEQGHIAGHDVLARFAAALGGRLHQAIYFDDGDLAAIA